MKQIESLKGKTLLLLVWVKVGLIIILAKSHSVHFDEVWAINGVASVIYHDRVFMMDPASRIFRYR